MYMVFFVNLPSSFDNLVTSLESMSSKDVDLQFIVVQLLHEASKKNKMKLRKMPHCLIKFIRQMKSFVLL